MSLHRALSILTKRWLLILTTVAAALGTAYATTPKVHVYSAGSLIVVGPFHYGPASSSGAVISTSEALGLYVLLLTYSQLIPTEPLAEAAVSLTDVPRPPGLVAAETSAGPVGLSQVLAITVTDPSPVIAAKLANGMAQAFANKVNSYPGTATVGTVPSVQVNIFEHARVPTAPVPTDLKKPLFYAAVLGLLAALLAAAVVEALDVSIMNAQDAERRLDLPVLGTIPFYQEAAPQAGPRVLTDAR